MASRRDNRAPGGPGGWVVRWAIWWVVLFAMWLVLSDTAKPQFLAGGALVAAIAATAARAVAAQRMVQLEVEPRLLRRAWRPFARTVPDTGLLIAALWRRLVLRRPVEGTFRQLHFRTAAADRDATTRRVLAKGFGSLAPNTYVVGFDEEREVMLVHQLVPTGDANGLDPLELR